jgi:hypothetical protein
VQKAIKSGRITPSASGKIDAVIADGQWDKNTAPRPTTRSPPAQAASSQPAVPIAEPPPRAESPGSAGLEYSRARAVRETYLAKMSKIDYDERSNNLVSRQEMEVAAFNKYRTFRDNILNIADRVSAVLAAESDPANVHKILSMELRKALQEDDDGDERR